MALTRQRRGLLPLGLSAAGLVAAGALVWAIAGAMGHLAVALVWAGLLAAMLFFYVYFPEIRDFVGRRSTRHAANAALMSGVFLAIVAMISFMSTRYKHRVDFTADGRYTLSAQTVKILKSLGEDVEAIAFYRSDERTRQAMSDLLGEYAYHSPRFRVRFVDPDRDPSEAARHGVTSYRTTLLKIGDRQEIIGTESENKLTNALIRLLAKRVKVFYVITGHGEKRIDNAGEDGYSYLKDALERENHQVRELLLMSVSRVPDDAAVLVVAGPQTDYTPEELERIGAYVERGGKVLFMLDPGGARGLAAYLAQFGFEVNHDLVVDKMSQVYGANYLMPVVVGYYKDHPVTREFELATFFPIARTVNVKEDPARGRYELARTSDKAWSISGPLTKADEQFDPDRHRRGPLSVVAVTAVEVAVTGEKGTPREAGLQTWGKILVTGDSDFASNKFLKTAGNRDFALNMLNWLAEEETLISIRRKEPGLSPLMLGAVEGRVVFWLSVVILPSLVLMAAVAVAVGRRRSV